MADEQPEQPDQQGPATGGPSQRRYSIEKLYLKDVSFESPNSPAVFTGAWSPEIKLQLNSHANPVAEHLQEVVLSVTVTATQGEQTGFLAEVQQAGIFRLEGFTADELQKVIAIECPTVLFPFAREAVSELVTKGGFPPLILAPVNFHAVYLQRQAQANQVAQGGSQTAH
jgi:preprotein translocase subunit SecB